MKRKLLLLAGALSGMAVTASAQTIRSYVTLPDRSALYAESEEYEFSDVRDTAAVAVPISSSTRGKVSNRSMVSASP